MISTVKTTDDSIVQRKLIEILRILYESNKPIGARLIADKMNERGFHIGERGVRYHLRILDERSLTKRHGYDGRVITEAGINELNNALVKDRLGFISSRIEKLIYSTDFNLKTKKGKVVINTSIIDKDDFETTMEIISDVIHGSYFISPFIKIIEENTFSSDIKIPKGKLGIATMCSITIDGILLKNGIPVDARYGGILNIENKIAKSFDDIIVYNGTSIDPMKIFISRKMTDVISAVNTGKGKLLSSVREIPESSLSHGIKILELINKSKIGGIAAIGEPGCPVLNAPVSSGKVGIAAYAGINTIAGVEEKGIFVDSTPISTVIDFKEMKKI